MLAHRTGRISANRIAQKRERAVRRPETWGISKESDSYPGASTSASMVCMPTLETWLKNSYSIFKCFKKCSFAIRRSFDGRQHSRDDSLHHRGRVGDQRAADGRSADGNQFGRLHQYQQIPFLDQVAADDRSEDYYDADYDQHGSAFPPRLDLKLISRMTRMRAAIRSGSTSICLLKSPAPPVEAKPPLPLKSSLAWAEPLRSLRSRPSIRQPLPAPAN